MLPRHDTPAPGLTSFLKWTIMATDHQCTAVHPPGGLDAHTLSGSARWNTQVSLISSCFWKVSMGLRFWSRIPTLLQRPPNSCLWLVCGLQFLSCSASYCDTVPSPWPAAHAPARARSLVFEPIQPRSFRRDKPPPCLRFAGYLSMGHSHDRLFRL